MKMLREAFLGKHRIASVIIVLSLFVILTLYTLRTQRQPPQEIDTLSEALQSLVPEVQHQQNPLPEEYQQSPEESPFCASRFGVDYLRSLSKTSRNYCEASSGSSLNCFHSQTSENGRVDSFCIGGPASFDSDGTVFNMNCEQKDWSQEEVEEGYRRIERFPQYWYDTGPRHIFNNYIHLDAAAQVSPPPNTSSNKREFVILVKREDHTENIWHSLMEIASYSMTMDVLRMTEDPETREPFLSKDDFQNTQILILDDRPEGPFYELWSLFADRPIVRLKDASVKLSQYTGNVIVPLPGGSNPLWQGDWNVHNCQHSAIWRIFSQRVLTRYAVDDKSIKDDARLVLTFIDRKEKRRLIDKEAFIEKLRSKFPDVEIDSVDYASLSFAEQLNATRRSDILVGVHGAGLTHGMFMRPGSAMVEILPQDFNHKGFRNLAKIMGHQYFSSHAVKALGGSGDWQIEDVILEEDRFMGLLDVAVKSMYNRGTLDKDVTK